MDPQAVARASSTGVHARGLEPLLAQWADVHEIPAQGGVSRVRQKRGGGGRWIDREAARTSGISFCCTRSEDAEVRSKRNKQTHPSADTHRAAPWVPCDKASEERVEPNARDVGVSPRVVVPAVLDGGIYERNASESVRARKRKTEKEPSQTAARRRTQRRPTRGWAGGAGGRNLRPVASPRPTRWVRCPTGPAGPTRLDMEADLVVGLG